MRPLLSYTKNRPKHTIAMHGIYQFICVKLRYFTSRNPLVVKPKAYEIAIGLTVRNWCIDFNYLHVASESLTHAGVRVLDPRRLSFIGGLYALAVSVIRLKVE